MKKQLLILSAIFALTACTQIDTGNVGVERTLGNVKMEQLSPGIYQTITKTVDEFTTKEIHLPVENLRPKSVDNLTMQDVDIDVYYKVIPSKIAPLFVKYQGDVVADKNGDLNVAQSRVTREAREAVYSAVSKFDATTIHTKRAELADAIQKTMQTGLNTSDPESFVVTTVNVRNIVTDAALEKSIQERAAVDQQIAAKQKQVELAKQEAERRRVEATGEAQANRILADSVTPNLIQYKRLEVDLIAASKTSSVVQINGGASALVDTRNK
jgi:regulator of protease activity HflC (stomatin/prohibitin superfamily)